MRVLFVTYYYPPSGGPGVQRSLKFSRYLGDFGWTPVILTVHEENAAWPARDESLLEEIPPSLEIHRTRAFDPYAAYARLVGKERSETVGVGFLGESNPTWRERLGRWIRANVFLPDARVGWVPYAIQEARKIISGGGIDALLTTGPPHSTHLIGRYLARRFDLPWVADFRDPWVGIDYAEMLPAGRFARSLDARMERSVLSEASAVTVVSPSMADALNDRVPVDYDLLYNGYDPNDFHQKVEVEREHFIISHTGSLNEARNPEVLWRALETARARENFPKLRVRLIGRVDPIVLESARRHGVEDLVEVRPYLDHPEVIVQIGKSAMLLLVINRVQGAEGILTGKLFEYVGSGRPVLCIGPTEGDAASVLQDVGAGETFGYQDVEGVARMIRRHYEAWRADRPLPGASPTDAARYSRREQAGELAALLTSVSGRVRQDRGLS